MRPVVEDHIMSHYEDHIMWGAVRYKCYAEEPETIDALKDNTRKAIGEIQLHTIDNVLKNWTAWPAEAGILMKSFSIINRKVCTFK